MLAQRYGCYTCKTRKVKCDGEHPVCARCAKSNRICVNSSILEDASLCIHAENQYAAGRCKRPRGPRSSKFILDSRKKLEAQARAAFFQFHIQPMTETPNILGDLSRCVASWKRSGKVCAIVELAITSLALAVYSNIHQHAEAAMHASSKYNELLRVAQECMAEISTASDVQKTDAYLLTIHLMNRFESTHETSEKPKLERSFSSAHAWLHHDGSLAVLKTWYDAGCTTPSAIIRQSRRGAIKSALLRNLRIPEWLEEGSVYGEEGLELEYDRAHVKIINLYYDLNFHQRMGTLIYEKAICLDNSASDILRDLESWKCDLASIRPYLVLILPEHEETPNGGLLPPQVYKYATVEQAAVWSQYFATALLLYTIKTRILESVSQTEGMLEQKHESTEHIQKMANAIAASIPSLLGTSKAQGCFIVDHDHHSIKPSQLSLAVWPLSIAASVPEVGTMQQSWFRRQLAQIGRMIGSRVIGSADTEHWAQL